ncbi:MAG: hypothetical protein FWG84_00145 [Bacteroidales bacterium]|nr:hypothetical protein [Bacteroidales bacterium]
MNFYRCVFNGKFLTEKPVVRYGFLVTLCVLSSIFCSFRVSAQQIDVEFDLPPAADSSELHDVTAIPIPDLLTPLLPSDTLLVSPEKVKKEMLETKVERSSDSSMLDMKARKAYLYGNAEITYGSINLKAAYIEVDFAKSTAFAAGVADSTGTLTGMPVLVEKGQEYKAVTMKYNFETKRGLIHTIITQEGDGFMHGSIVKKDENDVLSVANGWYTTCDLDHPHFGLKFGKAKVIPDNKIVVGPAYMVIEDAPTPLALPFALIPNKKNQKSGIIVPGVETKNEMGMGFVKGGYYWYINDYMDFRAVGDIYTRGTWAVEPAFRYKKLYQYTGDLNLGYSHIMKGVAGTPSYRDENNYRLQWMHNQDPKAHPVNRFSANVTIQSSNYNYFHPTNTQDRLTNTYSSNINFSTSFSRFNYSVSAGYVQNTQTHNVDLTLPSMNLNMNQVYLFRKKVQQGPLKWYENINVRYTMSAINTVKATDSTMFKGNMPEQMNYGMRHNIPIAVPIKILKVLNGELGAGYNEYWYGRTISRRNYVDTAFTVINGKGTYTGHSKIDTINGFSSTRDFELSASLNTKLYGLFLMKGGPIKAVRHVLTPAVSFSYHPDFGTDFWGNYRTYLGREGEDVRYSRYQGAAYRSPPDGVSGLVNFSLSNNLEMKVRNRADTITGTKKIKLIDIFSANIGYDVAKDSLNWTPLRLSGTTTVFQSLRISYNGFFDVYALNEEGTASISKTEWEVNRRLFRFNNADWAFNLDYRLNPNTFKKNTSASPPPPPTNPGTNLDRLYEPDYYIDWSVPWNLSFGYTLTYTHVMRYQMQADPNNPNDTVRTSLHDRKNFQTTYFSGDITLTPKWKVSASSGYDFSNKRWNFTSIRLFRDLHCWEMSFEWEPIGDLKRWAFHINIKASSLMEAIKYDKKKDFRDNW